MTILRVVCAGVLGLPFGLHAQERNWNWYLPGGDLFDHSGDPPVLTTGLPPSSGAGHSSTACMSDVMGQPLFYALRNGVHDANYQLMPNSPDPDSIPFTFYSQSVIALPFPGEASRYVVCFTGVVPNTPTTRAMTLEVDMSLNGGLGDVVPGSFQWLADSTTAHVTAVLDEENGYWMLLHRFNSDAFLSFHITSSGIDTVPVVSNTGPVLFANDPFNTTSSLYLSGTLVADLAGERLAMTASPGGLFSDLIGLLGLYRFDRANGSVQFQHGLPVGNVAHGVEFSSDGTRLYVVEEHATDSVPMDLVQFTVSGNDSLSIASTRFVVSTAPLSGAVGSVLHNIVLCPDGKIRLRSHRDLNSDLTLMDVIHKPDSAGSACQFQLNEFTTSLGSRALPNFCKRYPDSEPAWLSVPERDSPAFTLWPNPSDGTIYLTFVAPYAHALLSVVDVTGRIIHGPVPVQAMTSTINMQDQAPGLYFMRVQDRAGSVHAKPFVLSK
jgi:hypothetical protein